MAENFNYQNLIVKSLVAFYFPTRFLELRTYAKLRLGIRFDPCYQKLYTSKEDRAAALKRHLEFFNTHPYVAAPIIGVTLALEEERANGAEIDDTAIQGLKLV